MHPFTWCWSPARVNGGGILTMLLGADADDWESSISSPIWVSCVSTTRSCPSSSLLSSSPSSTTLDIVLKYYNIHLHFCMVFPEF